MNKNEFVEKNYKLIASACKKYHNMCSGYIEFEDFYNNCCLLFLTRKSFNPDVNTKPSPFVYKVVLMEALTTIRKNQSQKRKISQGDLLSLDFIYNNENSSKSDFKENRVYKKDSEDDVYYYKDKECTQRIKGLFKSKKSKIIKNGTDIQEQPYMISNNNYFYLGSDKK